ncbi:MAG: glycosyltransferase, partial [Vicinamibacterales bacterium]
CSDYQREVATAQEGFRAEQAVTITHGVHLPRFAPRVDRAACRRSLGLKADGVVIGTIGRPIEEKGHTHLIDAATTVLERHPEAEFLIVGEGQLRAALEAQAARAGLGDRVHFTGARSDVPELLSIMDVFAFPSISEGFGIAVLEAMASRLPVIASDIRPLADIIEDSVTGLLVPAGDGAALARAVTRVLDDADLRFQLAARGRALVERQYTDRHMVGAHEELYLALTRQALTGRTGTGSATACRDQPEVANHARAYVPPHQEAHIP